MRLALFLGGCAGSYYAGMTTSRLRSLRLNGETYNVTSESRNFNLDTSLLTNRDFEGFFRQFMTHGLDVNAEKNDNVVVNKVQ